jgi:hypothetical protein
MADQPTQPHQPTGAEAHEANPFEGLDVLSPREDLAVAEIHQQLTELGDSDDPNAELQQIILRYELDAIDLDLARTVPVFVPVGKEEVDRRVSEGKDVLRAAGLSEMQLSPGHIIRERADQARWRLSGLDPDNLPNPRPDARKEIETAWADAARAATEATVAGIEARAQALRAQQCVLDYTTGEKNPDISAELYTLYAEAKRLSRRGSGGAYFTSRPTVADSHF